MRSLNKILIPLQFGIFVFFISLNGYSNSTPQTEDHLYSQLLAPKHKKPSIKRTVSSFLKDIVNTGIVNNAEILDDIDNLPLDDQISFMSGILLRKSTPSKTADITNFLIEIGNLINLNNKIDKLLFKIFRPYSSKHLRENQIKKLNSLIIEINSTLNMLKNCKDDELIRFNEINRSQNQQINLFIFQLWNNLLAKSPVFFDSENQEITEQGKIFIEGLINLLNSISQNQSVLQNIKSFKQFDLLTQIETRINELKKSFVKKMIDVGENFTSEIKELSDDQVIALLQNINATFMFDTENPYSNYQITPIKLKIENILIAELSQRCKKKLDETKELESLLVSIETKADSTEELQTMAIKLMNFNSSDFLEQNLDSDLDKFNKAKYAISHNYRQIIRLVSLLNQVRHIDESAFIKSLFPEYDQFDDLLSELLKSYEESLIDIKTKRAPVHIYVPTSSRPEELYEQITSLLEHLAITHYGFSETVASNRTQVTPIKLIILEDSDELELKHGESNLMRIREALNEFRSFQVDLLTYDENGLPLKKEKFSLRQRMEKLEKFVEDKARVEVEYVSIPRQMRVAAEIYKALGTDEKEAQLAFFRNQRKFDSDLLFSPFSPMQLKREWYEMITGTVPISDPETDHLEFQNSYLLYKLTKLDFNTHEANDILQKSSFDANDLLSFSNPLRLAIAMTKYKVSSIDDAVKNELFEYIRTNSTFNILFKSFEEKKLEDYLELLVEGNPKRKEYRDIAYSFRMAILLSDLRDTEKDLLLMVFNLNRWGKSYFDGARNKIKYYQKFRTYEMETKSEISRDQMPVFFEVDDDMRFDQIVRRIIPNEKGLPEIRVTENYNKKEGRGEHTLSIFHENLWTYLQAKRKTKKLLGISDEQEVPVMLSEQYTGSSSAPQAIRVHSTIEARVEFIEKVLKSMDTGSKLDMIYEELSSMQTNSNDDLSKGLDTNTPIMCFFKDLSHEDIINSVLESIKFLPSGFDTFNIITQVYFPGNIEKSRRALIGGNTLVNDLANDFRTQVLFQGIRMEDYISALQTEEEIKKRFTYKSKKPPFTHGGLVFLRHHRGFLQGSRPTMNNVLKGFRRMQGELLEQNVGYAVLDMINGAPELDTCLKNIVKNARVMANGYITAAEKLEKILNSLLKRSLVNNLLAENLRTVVKDLRETASYVLDKVDENKTQFELDLEEKVTAKLEELEETQIFARLVYEALERNDKAVLRAA